MEGHSYIETGSGVNTTASFELKLQIFHSILNARSDLSPVEAAESAKAVFQKLCASD